MGTLQRFDPAPSVGHRRAVGNSALILVVLAGMSLLLPLVPFPLEWAVTLGMTSTLVAWLLFRARDGALDWFEIVLPIGLLYVVYFGVGALHMKASPGRLFGPSLDNHVTPALLVALAGFAAMMAGYGLMFRQTHASPSLAVEPSSLGILALGALGAVGSVGSILQIGRAGAGGQISTLFSALNQFAPLFLLAWALAWYMLWAKRLDVRGRLVLFAVLVPAAGMIIAATFGGKEMTVLLMLVPLIARWYARRSMPWVSIITAALLTIFVVFPLYNTFRAQRRDLGTTARIDRALMSASHWDEEQYLENSTTAFLDRMSVISSVAAILRDVPGTVPYCYGSTLVLAPVSLFIPRFLWPDKPVITIGREFGETFLLVASWDAETLIAPTIVGDFYWNFALPGVIGGMLLFGGGMRWLYQRYGAGASYDPMRKATYISLLVIVTHFEGNVAALVTKTIKTVLIVLVATYVMRRFGLVRDLEPGP